MEIMQLSSTTQWPTNRNIFMKKHPVSSAILALSMNLAAQEMHDTLKIIGYDGSVVRAWSLNTVQTFASSNPGYLSLDTMDADSIRGTTNMPYAAIEKIVFVVDPDDPCRVSGVAWSLAGGTFQPHARIQRKGRLVSFLFPANAQGELSATVCDIFGKTAWHAARHSGAADDRAISWDGAGRMAPGIYLLRQSLNGAIIYSGSFIIK